MSEHVTLEDVQRAAQYLKASSLSGVNQYYAIMNPKAWNGFWYVQKVIPFFRWLGRKLHSRRLYWLGFQVVWITGVKDWR